MGIPLLALAKLFKHHLGVAHHVVVALVAKAADKYLMPLATTPAATTISN